MYGFFKINTERFVENSMDNWKVYLVECCDGSYYCGITNKQIQDRVKAHNNGTGSKYTRGRRPVKLFNSINGLSRSDAARLEYRIKKLPKDKKLELFAFPDQTKANLL